MKSFALILSFMTFYNAYLLFDTQITTPITVTIGLDWDVTSVGKPIPAAYTTQVNNGTVLVDILKKAADDNPEGPFNKYDSTYYGGLGHFITAMNGTEQVSMVQISRGAEDDKLKNVLYREAQPEDPNPTPFRYHFDRKNCPFTYLS